MVSIGNFKSVQSMFSALSYYLTGRLVWAASLDMIHTCANAGQDRDAVNMWTFFPGKLFIFTLHSLCFQNVTILDLRGFI